MSKVKSAFNNSQQSQQLPQKGSRAASNSQKTSQRTNLTIAGLDPGFANLGLGVIREAGKDAVYVDSQLVRTSSQAPQEDRLATLYAETSRFFAQHAPDVLAIESQYFYQRGDIGFKVGQAFGVCLLAAKQAELAVVMYTPLQVKQTLVGSGRAGKAQVGYMVRALLGLDAIPESHHVADALALALTHMSSRSLHQLR